MNVITKSSFNKSVIYGFIKGYGPEKENVSELLGSKLPDSILLSISKEELDGLMAYLGNTYEFSEDDIKFSSYDEMYCNHLSEFGDVNMPSPALVAAVEYSIKNNIILEPIDLPEDQYTELYLNSVSTFDMIKHTARINKFMKFRLDNDSPYEFVKKWDEKIRQMKGFRIIEEAREKFMAEKIIELDEKYERSIALIEYEMFDNIVNILRANQK